MIYRVNLIEKVRVVSGFPFAELSAHLLSINVWSKMLEFMNGFYKLVELEDQVFAETMTWTSVLESLTSW